MTTLNTTVKNQATKKQSKKVVKSDTLTAEVIQAEFIEIVQNNNVQSTELIFVATEETKPIAKPQFSHSFSKVKKAFNLSERQSLVKTLISAKFHINNLSKILDSSNDEYFVNLNNHKEGVKFTNYITNPKNDELLLLFAEIVKKDKNDLFTEYKTVQAIQKVSNFVVNKNMEYKEAINYIIAQNYQAKKELL